MADTDQVLNLAAIICKVDGNHSKGAAALAESILDHPNFRDVLARSVRPRPPAASAAGRGGGGMSQPLSPVEELQERYRSAADEYPDPDGFAAALRAVADQVVPEPPTWEIGVLSAADREVEIRREILAIADELENHQ